MGDRKYESIGNGDLTSEQLDGMEMWDRDVMLDERHRYVGSMLVRRAVAEIRRSRALLDTPFAAILREVESHRAMGACPFAGLVAPATCPLPRRGRSGESARREVWC